MRSLVILAFSCALACAIGGLACSPAFAAEPSALCAAKRSRIETQIGQAQAAGRQQEVAGLKSALRANQRHCTDASLQADRDKAIAAAQKKVARREADLARARAKGDEKKIAKEQAQLEDARRALDEARQPLSP